MCDQEPSSVVGAESRRTWRACARVPGADAVPTGGAVLALVPGGAGVLVILAELAGEAWDACAPETCAGAERAHTMNQMYYRPVAVKETCEGLVDFQ